MATTAIWKIQKRLDHVISYTTDELKTYNKNYGETLYKDLHDTIDYVEDNYKTEKQSYVTCLNCSKETALEEMIITKKQFNKNDGILGYHAYQSFAENEVTPELAHLIGVKLAEEMWGDRFEVIISTHLNTKHYHNHFVINSVSFKDGKKYYDKRSTYAELRKISDSICEEYSISVVKEKKCKNSKIDYSNYQKAYMQRDNYYVITKKDIDKAIRQATSIKDFEKLIKAMNYEMTYRYNKISIRRDPYKKNIRIERCFGEEYSIDRIKERIESEKSISISLIDEFKNKKYYSKTNYKKYKPKGIYALYLHYCYLLHVFPNKYPYVKLPISIKVDVNKLDIIIEETKLLVSNKLETDEQFFLYKNNIEEEVGNLVDEREKLWYKHKTEKDRDEQEKIVKRIEEINSKLKPLRDKLKLCEGIEERIPSIESNINKYIEQNRKESERNEYIK